jgi:hypothetical protein
VNVYAARQRYRKKWDVNCVFEKSLGYTIDGSRSKTAARPSSPLPAPGAPLSSSSPPKRVSTGVFSAFTTDMSLAGKTYRLRRMRSIFRRHPEAPSRVRRRDLDWSRPDSDRAGMDVADSGGTGETSWFGVEGFVDKCAPRQSLDAVLQPSFFTVKLQSPGRFIGVSTSPVKS